MQGFRQSEKRQLGTAVLSFTSSYVESPWSNRQIVLTRRAYVRTWSVQHHTVRPPLQAKCLDSSAHQCVNPSIRPPIHPSIPTDDTRLGLLHNRRSDTTRLLIADREGGTLTCPCQRACRRGTLPYPTWSSIYFRPPSTKGCCYTVPVNFGCFNVQEVEDTVFWGCHGGEETGGTATLPEPKAHGCFASRTHSTLKTPTRPVPPTTTPTPRYDTTKCHIAGYRTWSSLSPRMAASRTGTRRLKTQQKTRARAICSLSKIQPITNNTSRGHGPPSAVPTGGRLALHWLYSRHRTNSRLLYLIAATSGPESRTLAINHTWQVKPKPPA